MAGSTESGRARTPNKEANTDIPSLRGDDCEQIQSANTKILKRATLKIDFYFIPLMGMFSVSSLLLARRLLLSARLPFRPALILGECLRDRTSGGLNNGHLLAG